MKAPYPWRTVSWSCSSQVKHSLNTVINTMRPGNLPEMEDLRPLSALLRRVGTIDDSTDPTLKDAVAFTEMVIKYVADGSGTHDMIETAISRLKSAAGL